MLESKIYKIDSCFSKHDIILTFNYIEEQPVEFIIRTKDLRFSLQFAVLTRLVTHIFQNMDAYFLIEEFEGIGDPGYGAGMWKEGRLYSSVFSEIAGVFKIFFKEIGY